MKGVRYWCNVCSMELSVANVRRHEKQHKLCLTCLRIRGPKFHDCQVLPTFTHAHWLGVLDSEGKIMYYVLAVSPQDLYKEDKATQTTTE